MEVDFKDYYDTLVNNLNCFEGEYDSFIDYGPSLYKLLCDCLNSKQLSSGLRLNISAAIAYYVVPMDIIPEQVFGPYGYIDDIYISVYVLRKVVNQYGHDFLQDLWTDDESIEDVLNTCFEESVKILQDQVDDILSYVGLIV